MLGSIALITCGFWVLWVLHHDRSARHSDSIGVWIVIVWVLIHATRPMSLWLNIDSGTLSRDEGNPLNATIDLLLIIAVSVILTRRRLQWSQVIKENIWLFAFYLFWIMSISWSDDPFVTFKRVFRDFGNVLMVLAVLTEREPSDAIKAVCVRVAYICVPVSIILWKYYPGIGRGFTGYNGSFQMVVGVTQHKNSLGILVMVAALFLLWELLSRLRQPCPTGGKRGVVAHVLTLVMAWYLLAVANSATSLVCAILGSTLLIAFMSPSFSGVRRRLEVYAFAGLAVVAILSMVVDVKSAFFETVERNETLTTRTDMWPVLIDHQTNVLLGAGFNAFWSGAQLERLPEAYRGFVQAHNGYLETYLHGGVVGLVILVFVIMSAYWRARKLLVAGSPELCMKMVIIIVALVHNWSEASFNKVGLLWFVTLFGMMAYSHKSTGSWNNDARSDPAEITMVGRGDNVSALQVPISGV